MIISNEISYPEKDDFFIIHFFSLFIFQDEIRTEGRSEEPSEIRVHRDKSHDWHLDDALKRTHNPTMMSLLSDSSHHSDQEKGQATEESHLETEKPKVMDTRKRGRPRKPAKSPKRDRRTSDENTKSTKSRSRTRPPISKKKRSISKAIVPTSDDASDIRSRDASSDSDSDTPVTAVTPAITGITEKRKSRLSISSSEDESPLNGKNSGSEGEASRWRRTSVKQRSKLADSPKKQDKKKSPAKAKPRRPRSRVTNINGGSDSDSESEVATRNRIQVAR